MLERIRKKLKAEDGASLMIALLYFCLCAIVGSMILTAATVASGRMTGIKKNSQEYYTLTSAAKLFKDSWGEGLLTIYHDNGRVNRIDLGSYDDQLATLRDDMAEEIYSNMEDEEYYVTRTLFIHIDGDTHIPDVKADITMHHDYTTEIVFTYRNLADSATNSFVTLVFSSESIDVIDYNLSKTKLSWNDAQMYLGGDLKK